MLFIDARNTGHMVDRVLREFSDEDIEQIAGTYCRWRAKPETLGEKTWRSYAYQPGFCKSEGLETIRKFDHVLTPGRYVGTADDEGDGVPFEEKFKSLSHTLEQQFADGGRLQARIRDALSGVVHEQ